MTFGGWRERQKPSFHVEEKTENSFLERGWPKPRNPLENENSFLGFFQKNEFSKKPRNH
jgi:hypothetical protein